jgi:hypothetical protein
MRIASFVLPIVDNDGQCVLDVHLRFAKQIVETFGGLTTAESAGRWFDQSGAEYVENGRMYFVAMADNAHNTDKWRAMCVDAGRSAKQLCVMVTLASGEVEFHDL